MTVFANYARYYDLLYRDKDYAGEAAFINILIRKHAPLAQSLLELGSGTGRHAFLLAEQGCKVRGVEMSEAMLQQACQRLDAAHDELRARLRFTQGDLRTVRLQERFDAVTALFHVMSYQTGNEDLRAAFATVKAHLNPGGLFIFDAWYGPAVLAERPSVRVKRLEDDTIQVTRIAEPVLRVKENRVDVGYTIFVRDKATGQLEEIREMHPMRYLFRPEVRELLEREGFEEVACAAWMSERPPGADTWGVYWIARLLP